MEDFAGAYLARKSDIFALPRNQNHTIAIFHLGGVAVECQLKAMLLVYHKITDWKDPSRRATDLFFGQPIKNPSHDLLRAIQDMPGLYNAAILDSQFLTHLEKIKRPLGSTNPDYVSLRYIPETTESLSNWQNSFNYIYQWLHKNKHIIL
jgi:hypothetical protein